MQLIKCSCFRSMAHVDYLFVLTQIGGFRRCWHRCWRATKWLHHHGVRLRQRKRRQSQQRKQSRISFWNLEFCSWADGMSLGTEALLIDNWSFLSPFIYVDGRRKESANTQRMILCVITNIFYAFFLHSSILCAWCVRALRQAAVSLEIYLNIRFEYMCIRLLCNPLCSAVSK